MIAQRLSGLFLYSKEVTKQLAFIFLRRADRSWRRRVCQGSFMNNKYNKTGTVMHSMDIC